MKIRSNSPPGVNSLLHIIFESEDILISLFSDDESVNNFIFLQFFFLWRSEKEEEKIKKILTRWAVARDEVFEDFF